MQVLLRIANGKSNVRKVRIQSDTVIGRSPECQLKVASNQISRRHCQIVIRDTVVAIKDLGSANGTFVNGRQVPPEVEIPLTPGTRVMLGPLQFTVEYDLPGMPAVAVAAPSEAVVAEPAAEAPMVQVAVVEPQLQPQVHVETLQVVPPDGQTPFPPFVVVPPQPVPPQHIPPQPYPPAVAPAAVAVAAPVAPVNHVVMPQVPQP
ncbi:MAG: Forkhead-associated protein, partial [Planctomycetaceae bacterium]|nr:Forkhead-associated protein [Planctomycetaceae bacterium]